MSMKKTALLFALGTICLGLYSQAPAYVEGEIIVMLRSNEDVDKLKRDLFFVDGVSTELSPVHQIAASMNLWLFNFNTSAISQNRMLDLVRGHRSVLLAQNDHTGIRLRADSLIPNDPYMKDLWHYRNDGKTYPSGFSGGKYDADMDATEAWAIETGSSGVTAKGDTIVVAVIDGGAKFPHEDLNWWKNYNEIPGNGIDDDGNGYKDDFHGWNAKDHNGTLAVNDHGTNVAGIVGAKGNNGKGVVGVCWGVKVMPFTNGWTKTGTNASKEALVMECYGYVIANRKLWNSTNGSKGAFIVATNSSFGIDYAKPSDTPIWCALYDSLGKLGIISCGATTNNLDDVDKLGDIPTNCPSNHFIGVAKTGITDNNASGYGNISVDLGAPGAWAYSTSSTGGYGPMGGTSQATPMVSGTIALMYAAACPKFIEDYKLYPDSIALLIRECLLSAVDTVSQLKGKYVTGGRLNAHKALLNLEKYDCTPEFIEQDGSQESSVVSKVFPNPFTGLLNIVFAQQTAGNVKIEVADLIGRTINSSICPVVARRAYIDLYQLQSGYYLIKVYDNNGNVYTEKMIKE